MRIKLSQFNKIFTNIIKEPAIRTAGFSLAKKTHPPNPSKKQGEVGRMVYVVGIANSPLNACELQIRKNGDAKYHLSRR